MCVLCRRTITRWSFANFNLRPRRINIFPFITIWFGNACRFDDNKRRINNLMGALHLILLNWIVAHCTILILLTNSGTTRFGPLIDWTIVPIITNIRARGSSWSRSSIISSDSMEYAENEIHGINTADRITRVYCGYLVNKRIIRGHKLGILHWVLLIQKGSEEIWIDSGKYDLSQWFDMIPLPTISCCLLGIRRSM
jgi:hypothetical protein